MDLHNKLYSQPCKIAYLGGSVTVQKNGYRPLLHHLICQITQQNHHAINAGIGGVGSIAHAFLLNEFVIKHQPDFCFIECAIVDGEGMTPQDQIQFSIESICLQLLQQKIPSCFLQLFKSKDLIQYEEILQHNYRPIIHHYQVPEINLHDFFSRQIQENVLQASDLLYDGIHTTDLGSTLFANQIATDWFNLLPSLLPNTFAIESRGVHQSLYPIIVGPDQLQESIEGNFKVKKFKFTIPYLEMDSNSSLNLECDFGEVIGILVIVDNDSGVIEIKTDEFTHHAQLHDQWCDHPRIQAVLLPHAIASRKLLSITLTKLDSAQVGANLRYQTWQHKGMNIKIIGLMVNSLMAPPPNRYLW